MSIAEGNGVEYVRQEVICDKCSFRSLVVTGKEYDYYDPISGRLLCPACGAALYVATIINTGDTT